MFASTYVKTLLPLAAIVTIASSCGERCYRCTAIYATESIYTRGTDTFTLLSVEGAVTTYDSLIQAGYTQQNIREVELPMDFEYCTDFKPEYRIKCAGPQ